MVSALICLSFLPWSILNLKEKSGRVIFAEFNFFPSHVVNKHTGLEDPLANVAMQECHAGRHSSIVNGGRLVMKAGGLQTISTIGAL